MKDSRLADALMEDYRTAPVDPGMKQLLAFAEKMALDATRIGPEDIERLRAAGFSDRAILDAAHVTGFFSYMNRVVQALGVDGKMALQTEASEVRALPLDGASGSHVINV